MRSDLKKLPVAHAPDDWRPGHNRDAAKDPDPDGKLARILGAQRVPDLRPGEPVGSMLGDPSADEMVRAGLPDTSTLPMNGLPPDVAAAVEARRAAPVAVEAAPVAAATTPGAAPPPEVVPGVAPADFDPHLPVLQRVTPTVPEHLLPEADEAPRRRQRIADIINAASVIPTLAGALAPSSGFGSVMMGLGRGVGQGAADISAEAEAAILQRGIDHNSIFTDAAALNQQIGLDESKLQEEYRESRRGEAHELNRDRLGDERDAERERLGDERDLVRDRIKQQLDAAGRQFDQALEMGRPDEAARLAEAAGLDPDAARAIAQEAQRRIGVAEQQVGRRLSAQERQAATAEARLSLGWYQARTGRYSAETGRINATRPRATATRSSTKASRSTRRGTSTFESARQMSDQALAEERALLKRMVDDPASFPFADSATDRRLEVLDYEIERRRVMPGRSAGGPVAPSLFERAREKLTSGEWDQARYDEFVEEASQRGTSRVDPRVASRLQSRLAAGTITQAQHDEAMRLAASGH